MDTISQTLTSNISICNTCLPIISKNGNPAQLQFAAKSDSMAKQGFENSNKIEILSG